MTLIAILCLGGIVARRAEAARSRENEIYGKPLAASPAEVLQGALLTQGSPRAPRKLVIFGDYQCPPCHAAWERLGRIPAVASGEVAVLWHHNPLSLIHPLAEGAAEAAASLPPSAALLAHRALMRESLTSKRLKAL